MMRWILLFLWLPSFAGGFPSAAVIDRQVWFWEQIFLHYDNKQVVIHDSRHPEIIIDVIDLRAMKFATKKSEDRWIEDLQKRYQKGAEHFKTIGSRAYLLGSIERRLYQVYGQKRRELLKGQVILRTQRGLKDVFDKAIKRSSPYIQEMERIFRSHGLPKDLTRLAFVESMFNVAAKSKVGASGIWQFMPGTARRYLTVNRNFDERNSPLKATTAAAKLLKHNFHSLGNWPLAITAYNHGLNGMRRAVRTTKSKKLSVMIKSYKGRSFGFASRNFYGEFLAARRVYGIKTKTMKSHRRPLGQRKIILPKPVTPAKLVANTALTKSELKSLNLCLNARVFRKGYHRPLPKNYTLWVPQKKFGKINRALKRL